MDIKVGDRVRVKNWGQEFSTALNWCVENKDDIPIELLIRYAYGDSSRFIKYGSESGDTNVYRVLYIKNRRAIIGTNNDFGAVYIIAVSALESEFVELTLEEVEKRLGYRVKIVDNAEKIENPFN